MQIQPNLALLKLKSFNFLDIFLVSTLNYYILPQLGSLEKIPHGCPRPLCTAQQAVISVAVKTARLSAGLESLLNLITLCFSTVMDVTDIITGKMDDEDKQHFIPFQP